MTSSYTASNPCRTEDFVRQWSTMALINAIALICIMETTVKVKVGFNPLQFV